MSKGKAKQFTKNRQQQSDKGKPSGQSLHRSEELKQAKIKKELPDTIPGGPKFEWSFKNPKFRAVLLFAFFVISFLFVWKQPEVKSLDPWYEAYFMVDSSMKVTDPILKRQLLNDGGDRLRELVKEYPYHAKLHLLLGIYFEVAGKWDSAIVEQKESMKLGAGGTINPVTQDAARQLLISYLNKSNQQIADGDFTGARKTIDDAISQKLNSPDLLNQIAVFFHRQGNLDSAAYYYEKVLAVAPQHKAASANLGMIYFISGNNLFKSGRLDQAILHYQKSIELSPSNADAYSNMGFIYSQQNKMKDAIAAFQKSLETKPDNQNAIRGLITCYKRTGETRLADELMKKYGINQ
jgi:tetratricopeptide (TPR) repeat protein